jgi:hypothetical protein
VSWLAWIIVPLSPGRLGHLAMVWLLWPAVVGLTMMKGSSPVIKTHRPITMMAAFFAAASAARPPGQAAVARVGRGDSEKSSKLKPPLKWARDTSVCDDERGTS